jgi:hypothetical protein
MAKHGLRRQGCCDGHSPRSVSVLPSELKALVRRNGLKLGHDGFPYRVGTTRIRRWAGFIDEPESSKESRLRAWSVLRQLRSVSFRGWKRRDSTTGTEDLRCRGRSLGTCIDENPCTSGTKRSKVCVPRSAAFAKSDFPHASGALEKLDRAEDLIQN